MINVISSWVFSASLVLGLGLLGGFGRILEKYARMSIRSLDQFAENDAHARQYSLIAQSLLTTALEHLEQQELRERLRRTESSSQLFGLTPNFPPISHTNPSTPYTHSGRGLSSSAPANGEALARNEQDEGDPCPSAADNQPLRHQRGPTASSPSLQAFDSAFLGLTDPLSHAPDANHWDTYTNFGGAEGETGSTLNLFPLLEAGGGIDLAHYL